MLWSRALFSQLRPLFIPLKMSSIFVKIQTGAEQKKSRAGSDKKVWFLAAPTLQHFCSRVVAY